MKHYFMVIKETIVVVVVEKIIEVKGNVLIIITKKKCPLQPKLESHRDKTK
jgi:hypothetical protein